jgi:hypothetical protein
MAQKCDLKKKAKLNNIKKNKACEAIKDKSRWKSNHEIQELQ